MTWLLLLLILFGCARNKVELSAENKLAKANLLFADKKYARAAELYDDISFEKKSASSALALMRLAECNYLMNKFVDARLKYTQMITNYPDYADIETAYFKIGVCYADEALGPHYDQTETLQCIEAFRVFTDKFPNSPQFNAALEYIRKAQTTLLKKKYQNGYIYFKMQDYSSALMYFKELIELGNTDELDRKALYYSIRIHLAQKNDTAAKDAWDRLKTKYPGSNEVHRLASEF